MLYGVKAGTDTTAVPDGGAVTCQPTTEEAAGA
jgi:hypothetical protein